MNIDLIFKIAAIGILITILNLVLTKAGREEIALMSTLAGLVIVLMMVAQLINELFQSVRTLFQL
ncbi:stage III sporulation protein AC [Christensenellaceae bacterium NSJ-44]|jgi:stage III sporulation protein AC|uniref:Stage III sporulation protein AC n=1 Tax=Luoshenia tenuis TaxID=2763654 RepID=A0A926CZM0_9FIRM|nr:MULTISPECIES: stage III sporulation protein AC [Clostridia]MBC8528877.1 stage III sporulation protein AC [Luoshenia tenuis]SCJ20947.1 stage III sporulation protein AC [uncultured Clostridium sp.]